MCSQITLMKKKEFNFTANLQEDAARELIATDVQKIQEITPGFQAPVLVKPMDSVGEVGPKHLEAKTFLRMPIKKEKKEL